MFARVDFVADEMPPLVVSRCVRQSIRGRVEPRRRKRPAESRDAKGADGDRRTVPDVVQVVWLRRPALPRRDAIERFVVPFDPEERLWWLGIRAGATGEIADADPQRDVAVPFHRTAQ